MGQIFKTGSLWEYLPELGMYIFYTAFLDVAHRGAVINFGATVEEKRLCQYRAAVFSSCLHRNGRKRAARGIYGQQSDRHSGTYVAQCSGHGSCHSHYRRRVP